MPESPVLTAVLLDSSDHDHIPDPTEAIRKAAAEFPEVVKGTSCNQNSFKTGVGSFLFVGPGPKGMGFKAMFKLKDSMPQAQELAEAEPARYQVGKTGWVTARFTAEDPLPREIWERWLSESYAIATGAGKKVAASNET